MANTEPNDPRNGGVVPDFFNKGESQNATQMISAALSQNASQMIYAALVSVPVTLVALNMMPDLDFLYRSIVILYRIIEKKKWAVHTAFMGLYVFAAVLIRSMTWPDKMLFGDKLLPFWGKAGPALEPAALESLYPLATLVFSQFVFAGITTILLAGALLGSMNFKAWMGFVPLWLSFSYTVGVFSLWGGGFLFQCGVIDFAGGYVIHLSSGVAGFTAAYWLGPRLQKCRERFLLMLTGAGFLWLGWCGLIGGVPCAAIVVSSMAVLNTNICAATSLLVWTCLDVIFFKKPSAIGAVQGMITGLICITPGSGVVQGWAAIVMGMLSGSIPWFTMMIVQKKPALLLKVDDTLAVLHTHAVAGLLGVALTGLFAEPTLCSLFIAATNSNGAFYGDGMQFVK